MRPNPIRAIGVIVPVNDEEALLDRCLRALVRAAAALRHHGGPKVVAVVVLDACQDSSAQIAERYDVAVVRVDAQNVGVARATGVRHALEQLAGLTPDEIWIASTDADSVVPRGWLRAQWHLADQGWDAVLGRVRADLSDLPDGLHPDSELIAPASHEPVYGANLGVRASAYLDVGGFEPVTEHEDQRLVVALREAGSRITASAAAPVLTSGRMIGRTPGGYAGFLRSAFSRT